MNRISIYNSKSLNFPEGAKKRIHEALHDNPFYTNETDCLAETLLHFTIQNEKYSLDCTSLAIRQDESTGRKWAMLRNGHDNYNRIMDFVFPDNASNEEMIQLMIEKCEEQVNRQVEIVKKFKTRTAYLRFMRSPEYMEQYK